MPGDGTIVAVTSIHHSLDEFFRDRLPWRIASVRLDAGPVLFAHLAPGKAAPGSRVRVATARDRADGWCVVTLPEQAAQDGRGVLETMAALGLNDDDEQQ